MLPLFSLKEHLTHTAKPFNKVFVGPTNPFALAENICLLPFKQNHQSDKFLRHREKKKKKKENRSRFPCQIIPILPHLISFHLMEGEGF